MLDCPSCVGSRQIINGGTCCCCCCRSRAPTNNNNVVGGSWDAQWRGIHAVSCRVLVWEDSPAWGRQRQIELFYAAEIGAANDMYTLLLLVKTLANVERLANLLTISSL